MVGVVSVLDSVLGMKAQQHQHQRDEQRSTQHAYKRESIGRAGRILRRGSPRFDKAALRHYLGRRKARANDPEDRA